MTFDRSPEAVTVDDILCEARRIITEYGWERLSWPEYGPMPRCTRAAISAAAIQFDVKGTEVHTNALRRVSEAIYRRGAVGGITEWEHYKRVNRDSVIAMLQKAIEIGPSERETRGELWPV
jgi:hypothetical protein